MKPYTNDADYLDAEFAYLAARGRRVAEEAALRGEPKPTCNCQLSVAREAEDRLLDQIDARLAESPRFGLDKLVAKHGLNADERHILVALAAGPVGGPGLLEHVYGSQGSSHWGWLDVRDVAQVTAAHDSAGMLRFRDLLGPHGKLVQRELVVVEDDGELPEDLWTARVSLTTKAFEAIVVGSTNSGA